MAEEAATMCAAQTKNERLSEAQRDVQHEVGLVYRMVRDGDTPSEGDLDVESWECRRWWKLWDRQCLSPAQILELWTNLHGQAIRCVVCPLSMQIPLVWEMH